MDLGLEEADDQRFWVIPDEVEPISGGTRRYG
jgi:hypothetical protein